MGDKFEALYEELFGKRFAEPEHEEDVRNILSCIQTRNGYLGNDNETELQGTSNRLNRTVKLLASDAREDKARFTKAISNQLYDDPFRFFFELIQNADDAGYSKARIAGEIPCVTFRVRATELVVDLNEDGFNLQDILAICSTGQSSKLKDAESTGEKGFGFKAVFGVASTVHIQSGLWSFSFNHQQHEDGIGMISPIWRRATSLPPDIRTRVTLVYSSPGTETLEELCHQLEAQPETIVSFLRNLRKLRIIFDNVLGRRYERCFERLETTRSNSSQIVATIDSVPKVHCFREFRHDVKDMPTREGRFSSVSTVTVWLPVSDFDTCIPAIPSHGQYISAYLPVCQVAQLPFLIQGDFILPASRQAVSENPWNKKLREGVAEAFALAAVAISSGNGYSRLQHQWPRFLPMSPITGFWHGLSHLIKFYLGERKAFLSRDDGCHGASQVRSLPACFLHKNAPLLPRQVQHRFFLSDKYKKSVYPALRYLGIQELSTQEMLDLISDDLKTTQSLIQGTALQHDWHDSFAGLLESLLRKKMTQDGQSTIDRLRHMRIVPVRDGQELVWWAAASAPRTIYFPVIVEDGNGTDRVHITMPTDLGLAVLHPTAASGAIRKRVYHDLGVQDCPPATICRSIERTHNARKFGLSSDMVAHFELLFWFSYDMSSDQRARLHAETEGKFCSNSSELFFWSEREHDTTQVARLEATEEHREYLLYSCYQKSTLSSRSRGAYSWESWLHKIAGIRWYPPLQASARHEGLHWVIKEVLKNNAAAFLPLIQAHWAEEYSEICRWNSKLEQALKQSKVLCRNGTMEELGKTWFPSRLILKAARSYGVEHRLPIVALPDSDKGCDLSEWSCLRDLEVASQRGLSFYRQVLVALADNGNTPQPSLTVLSKLYACIGSSATLEDQKELKTLFKRQKLIWDPEDRIWLNSNQCVWSSSIVLRRKLVIAAFYDEKVMNGLFKVLLELPGVTMEDLIDELAYMDQSHNEIPHEEVRASAVKVYVLLETMSGSSETRQSLRSNFSSRNLVYCNGQWKTASSCVWHETIDIGQHTPIAALYPSLRKFFVDTLGVNTVTDVYLMNELANAASQAVKDTDRIKNLMLSAAAMLTVESDIGKLQRSIAVLEKAKFLPCRTLSGAIEHVALSDAYFIVDNLQMANAFEGKITLLDFTYEQLNTLHTFLKLLHLEGRYLSRNVEPKTEEGDSALDAGLTQQLQQCAYAVSCCAVLHRSPRYFNQSVKTHDLLRHARVYTSPNIRTVYNIKQNRKLISVNADKAFLVLKEEQESLRIILPENGKERQSCFRSQLPGYLTEFLETTETKAEKQIYRFINELDAGTDELISDEAIPPVAWLVKTERLPQPTGLENAGLQVMPNQQLPASESRASDLRFTAVNDYEEGPIVVATTETIGGHQYRRQPYIPMPATVDHVQDAPEYHKVLMHVRSQAARVKWRDVPRDTTLTVRNDLTDYFSTLSLEGNDLEAASRPTLFGSDAFSNFRLGAAGELFVYEVLSSLTDVDMSLEDWQSTIRHFVRAHPSYAAIEAWRQKETADITYHDNSTMMESTLTARVLGDSYTGWLPTWLKGECTCSTGDSPCPDRLCSARETEVEPLEWLFEVKTTTGPCETDFFMSPGQYERMRKLGTVEDHSRGQVYCLVRVYNLLTDRIGIRFYIDPWRFRDSKLQFGTTDKWRVTAT